MIAVTPVPRPSIRWEEADPFRGRDMLCFSHDWNGDPLSKTHLMRLLACENRVLWVNSIGNRTPSICKRDLGRAFRKLAAVANPLQEVEPNLFVLNPLALPVYGSLGQALNRPLLRWQVKSAMRQLGFHRPINWVFNPAAGVVAGHLGEERLIYYCVDEYTAFRGVSTQALTALERQVLQRADLVVTSAEQLYQAKRSSNANTVLVRHGVDHEHFRRALDPSTAPPHDIASLPRPILGYFGLMSEDWFDLELMVRVARRFSHGSLVLLGKFTMDLAALRQLPNVHLLGHRPYRELPAYCKGFDVGLIPFPVSEVTRNANPLKAREYLAAGLPVVSTPVPEVSVLPYCRVGAGVEDFICQVESALSEPGSRTERSESMRGESWASRLDEVRQHFLALTRPGHTPGGRKGGQS